jgi:methyltransferase-like protein
LSLDVLQLGVTTNVAERPVASPLARLQATASDRATNLRHESVALDTFSRLLVQNLDGQRNRDELVERLLAAAAQGTLQLESPELANDHGRLRAMLSQAVDRALPKLAATALLTA